ncbi:MAG TPA: hypothetical protein VGR37_03745, partial [Longimicrobiaceae bacterium]|nr:hypothetical protein [Longimicrobiaceae bacterium]
MMQPELPTAPTVRRALDEVYALPEFTPRSLPGPLQWLSDRWGEVKAWFAGLLARFEVLEATAPLLFWLMIAGLALAALAILAHFARVGQGAWRARERRGRTAQGSTGP